MLSFSVSFFITIANFAILFFILKRFLWKPVREMIEKRGAKVKADLNDAALSKGVAEELRVRFEQQIATAEADADRILKEASEQASDDAKATVAGARSEAEKIKARAAEAAARETAAALEALTSEIARIATEAAARLAGHSVASADAFAAEALVRELGAERGR